MDLRQLAALAAVADHRSFSGAARALHTVQSNVSTHVARLEREVGAPLVNRQTGQLTDAGEIVVSRARRILAELNALTADVASSLGEVAGTVRFGVIGTTGRWLVPLLLEALGARHPDVRLVTVDATTTSLVPQLASGTLDLAVVNLPVVDPDVETEALFDEDHVVLAPATHPLAAHDRLSLQELAGIPLLLEPSGTGFRDDLDLDADRAGVELLAQAEVDGMRLLASFAYQGIGAAILPASATQASDDVSTRRSIPATATIDLVREVVAAEVPNRRGLHLAGRLD
jgi:LysR family hydrogen peroxide-inducible transcriptional activator